MDSVARLFNTYIGVAAMGLVLFYVFSDPSRTTTIIHQAGDTGADFINSLEGR